MPEKDTSIAPFYRQDTVPENQKDPLLDQVGRPSMNEKNPHYSGDNARSIIYPEQSQSKFKRLDGMFTFDKNNKVWNYTNEKIEKVVKELIGEKYNVDPNDVVVRINRAAGTIHYNYLYYVRAKRKKIFADEEDVERITVDMLRTGDVIMINPYWLDDWPSEERELLDKYNVRVEDKWKVIKPWIIKHEKSSYVINLKEPPFKSLWYGMPKPRNQIFLVKPGLKKYEKEKEEEKSLKRREGVKFETLPINTYFAFAEITENMKKSGMTYDMIFKKTKKNSAESVDDKSIKIKVPDGTMVIRKKDFEKEFKYKEDDLAKAFDDVFRKFKVTKGPTGKDVKLPFEDMKKIIEDNDLPYTKFELAEKKIKTNEGNRWVGSYVSPSSNKKYTWIRDNKEITLTCLE
jgi:hypothetical protein